ncbi:MAG: hypothetical protein KME14_10260 [Tildeniella torsiva UHER 1998/13D]|jgi:hypothetical protein|nr:hypothetical protein [Tildeniella torsiva UHER 1998/13D]
MTESSTNDKPKSTPTTPRSKALSTESEAAPETAVEAAAAAPDLSAYFPGYIRKLKGLANVAEAIETARKEAKLPSLNPTDYRFVLGRPGGIPFSFPVQVVYKPDSPKEHDLGTFRIGR